MPPRWKMNYKQEEIFNIEKTLQKIENPVFIEETLSTHFAKKRLFFPENSVFIEETLSTHLSKRLVLEKLWLFPKFE